MASQYPFPKSVSSGNILSPEERKICLKLCQANEEVTRKRAKALIALDEGHTQVNAGSLSELTRGQVNYLVTLFRKRGMELFPQNVIAVEKTKKKKKKKVADKKGKKKNFLKKPDNTEKSKKSKKKKRKKKGKKN